MEANKILNADILDIVFDGRNKQYGAYDLRRYYSNRMRKALLITGSAILILICGSVFAHFSGKGKSDGLEVKDIDMANVKETPPPVTPPPPPPPVQAPPPDLKQVNFTPPVIMKDEDVKPEDKIQAIDDDAMISNINKESDNTNQVVQAPVEEPNTGAIDVPKSNDDENKVFTKVEKEAAFDGDWGGFLKRYLNPDVPNDNGAPEGSYTVVVKFIVSKDGSLSDISCESDPGYGICQEAIRVIKKTKNWIPAVQNGNNVTAYRRQPITFQVQAQ
ncbi:energy transducer TonB [Ferruginibacter sp.]